MSDILIIFPNNVQLKKLTEKAGFWFSELVHFYTVLKLQKYHVDMVTPLGGKVVPDVMSTRRFFLDKEADAYYYSKGFMQKFEDTASIDSIVEKNYKAVYLAGGFAAIHYYTTNQRINEVVGKIFTNGGYVAATGLAVAALINLTTSNNDFLIDRKQITGLSLFEENLLGVRKTFDIHIQEEIKKRNAFYSKAFFPLTSYAIKDGRIITGENSNSTRAVAWQLVYSLRDQTKSGNR